MLQLYTMIAICSDWIFHPYKLIETDPKWHAFFFWLKLEFFYFLSYLLSTALFLFIRGIIQSAYYLYSPNAIANKTTDFLDANTILIGMICLMSAPTFVSCIIYVMSEGYGDASLLQSETSKVVFFIIMCIQIFQTITVFFITFTPNQIYMWSRAYNIYMPITLYALQYSIFLVLPIVISLLCLYAVVFCSVLHTVEESWFVLIGFFGIANVLWYHMTVAGLVEMIKEQYGANFEEEQKDEEDLIKSLKNKAVNKLRHKIVTDLALAINSAAMTRA